MQVVLPKDPKGNRSKSKRLCNSRKNRRRPIQSKRKKERALSRRIKCSKRLKTRGWKKRMTIPARTQMMNTKERANVNTKLN
jgi:hypothetical protein